VPNPLKILFVCGRNQWRSPTAERLYRGDPRVVVRSAGVSLKSAHKVSDADLDWADLVLVMERRYCTRIRSDFFARLEFPPIETLDIPDEFKFMDPELVTLLRANTEQFITALRPNPPTGRALKSGTPPARR
jgi:predicted protein tyrosine phosphatase